MDNGKWVGWHKTKQGWVAISHGESHKAATDGLRKAGVSLCEAAVMLRNAHPEDVDYLADCSCRMSRRVREDRLAKAKELLALMANPITVVELTAVAKSTTAQIKSQLNILQRAGLVSREKVLREILWTASTPEKKWPPGLQLNLFGDPFQLPHKCRRRRRKALTANSR